MTVPRAPDIYGPTMPYRFDGATAVGKRHWDKTADLDLPVKVSDVRTPAASLESDVYVLCVNVDYGNFEWRLHDLEDKRISYHPANVASSSSSRDVFMTFSLISTGHPISVSKIDIKSINVAHNVGVWPTVNIATMAGSDAPEFSGSSTGFSFSIGEPKRIGQSKTDDLFAVIEYAGKRGQKEIADRLLEISKESVEPDEMALHPEAAMNFVKYCIARKKQSRPLMTVTPTGELDTTWKDPRGCRVVMRFFEDGSVWVACKLSKMRGSFQVEAAADLLDAEVANRIPDWA